MKELGADQVTILIGSLTDLLENAQLPVYSKGNEWQKRYKDINNTPNTQWADWNAPEPKASYKRMQELSHVDPLSKVMQKDLKLADPNADYLADGVLDKMNEEDEVTRLRLKDALVLFDGAENESKVEIERLQKLYA